MNRRVFPGRMDSEPGRTACRGRRYSRRDVCNRPNCPGFERESGVRVGDATSGGEEGMPATYGIPAPPSGRDSNP